MPFSNLYRTENAKMSSVRIASVMSTSRDTSTIQDGSRLNNVLFYDGIQTKTGFNKIRKLNELK